VRRAGLAQDLAIANRYFGERASKSNEPSVGVPEPIAPERIRTFGRPIPFLGILPGIGDPPHSTSLLLESKPWVESVPWPAGETIVALVVLLLIAILTLLLRRGIRVPYMALFLAVGLAGFMGGPLGLAGSLALAGAGWRKARGGGLA
jgi:hypothetical protein